MAMKREIMIRPEPIRVRTLRRRDSSLETDDPDILRRIRDDDGAAAAVVSFWAVSEPLDIVEDSWRRKAVESSESTVDMPPLWSAESCDVGGALSAPRRLRREDFLVAIVIGIVVALFRLLSIQQNQHVSRIVDRMVQYLES